MSPEPVPVPVNGPGERSAGSAGTTPSLLGSTATLPISARSVLAGFGRRPDAPRSVALLCVVWVSLVGVAVVGRLWQPAWNVTPLAGAALVAGAVFPSATIAAGVPVAALTISNLALPPYGSLAMAVVIHVAIAWPVLLGGLLRGGRWVPIVGGALASSLVFYLTTNLTHWYLTDDYPHSAAGLLACYWAALPFYRWMPLGDVAWSLALFGGVAGLDRLARGLTVRGAN